MCRSPLLVPGKPSRNNLPLTDGILTKSTLLSWKNVRFFRFCSFLRVDPDNITYIVTIFLKIPLTIMHIFILWAPLKITTLQFRGAIATRNLTKKPKFEDFSQGLPRPPLWSRRLRQRQIALAERRALPARPEATQRRSWLKQESRFYIGTEGFEMTIDRKTNF